MRRRLELDDGRTLEVELVPGEAVDDDVVDGTPMFAGRFLNALASGRVAAEGLEDETLEVVHLVRDLAEREGVLAPVEMPPLICRNCDAAIDATGASVVEALLERGEPALGSRGVFQPRARRREVASVAQVRDALRFDPVKGIVGVALEPPTLAEARPLWRWLEGDDPIDADVVRALGVKALLREDGRVTSAKKIARLIDGSALLSELVAVAFLEACYSPRCTRPVSCPACGTVHDDPSPSLRELELGDLALAHLAGQGEGFPSFEELAKRALEIADEVYAERRVANLPLFVEDGTPPVDGAGEPLMGSYQPVDDDDGLRFEIKLYYETFRRMYEEAPYDVDAELRDTIDHEVEHHLHHLAGYDPVADEEDREVRRDLERRYGKGAVRRAEKDAVVTELRDMGRFFFWGLLVAAVLGAAWWGLLR